MACLLLALGEAGLAIAFAGWVWREQYYPFFPLAWFLGGFALTAFFVIGHDCGHYSFLKNRRVMVALGHTLFLPLLYPFYAWKFSHDAHHKFTNRLHRTADIYFDNAWIPETVVDHTRESQNRPLMAALYRIARRVPPLGSLMHLIAYLYDARLYRGDHRRRVLFSQLFVFSGALALGALIYSLTDSSFALLHFWLLPAVFFQLWMSFYTYLHHTAEDIAYYPPEQWSPYLAQIRCTVNCLFPRWISFLHFNIDVHIPHHIKAGIPGYNLRRANRALRASPYAGEMRECPLTWRHLFRQWRACQLWDRERASYARFAETGRAGQRPESLSCEGM